MTKLANLEQIAIKTGTISLVSMMHNSLGERSDNHPYLDAGNVFTEMSSGKPVKSKTRVCHSGTLEHFEILAVFAKNG